MPPSNVPLDPNTVIDITHESLIRQWATLRKWVQDEYRAADTYRYVETNARLWKKGHAALLTMPYLGVALAWRKEQSPNAAWASRYGNAFDLAMDFLGRAERRRRIRTRLPLAIVAAGRHADRIGRRRRERQYLERRHRRAFAQPPGSYGLGYRGGVFAGRQNDYFRKPG